MLPQEWAELCVSVNGSAASRRQAVTASALAEYAVHQLFLTGMFMHNLCLKSSDQNFGRERLGVFQTAIRNETQAATQAIRRTEDVSSTLFGAPALTQMWASLLACIFTVVPSGTVLLATGAMSSAADALLTSALLCFLPCLAAAPWAVVLHTHALAGELAAHEKAKPLFAFHRPLFSSDSLHLPLLGSPPAHAKASSVDSSPLRSPVLLSPDVKKDPPLQHSYAPPQLLPSPGGSFASPSGRRPPRAPGTPSALMMPPLDEACSDEEDEHSGGESWEQSSSATALPRLSELLCVSIAANVEGSFQGYLLEGGTPLDMDMVRAAADGLWTANAEVMLRNELLLGTAAAYSVFQVALGHLSAHQLAADLSQLAVQGGCCTGAQQPAAAAADDLDATILESPRRRSSAEEGSPQSQGSKNGNPLGADLSTPSTGTGGSCQSTQNTSVSSGVRTVRSADNFVSPVTPPWSGLQGGDDVRRTPPSLPSSQSASASGSGSSSRMTTPAAVFTPASALQAARVPGAAWTVGRSLALRRAMLDRDMRQAASPDGQSPPAFATPGRLRELPVTSSLVVSPAHMAAVTSPDGSPIWAHVALGMAPLPAVAPSARSRSPAPRGVLSPLSEVSQTGSTSAPPAGAGRSDQVDNAPGSSGGGYGYVAVQVSPELNHRHHVPTSSPCSLPRVALDFGGGQSGLARHSVHTPPRGTAAALAQSPLTQADVSATRANSTLGSLNSKLGTPRPPLGMASRPAPAAPSPARNSRQNTVTGPSTVQSFWSSAYAVAVSLVAPQTDGGAAQNAALNTMDYVAAAAAAAEGMRKPGGRGTGRWSHTGGTAFGSPPIQGGGGHSLTLAGGGPWGDAGPMHAAVDTSALGGGLASP